MTAIKRFYISCKKNGIYFNIKHLYEKMLWQNFMRQLAHVSTGTFIESPFEIRGSKYIKLGENFKAKKRLQLDAIDEHNGYHFLPQICIGDNVSINYDVHIAAINKVIIENNVLIASKVFITDHFHGTTSKESLLIPPQRRILFSKGPVIIKEYTWIGEGVAIMPGVTIGKNCVIGANSVVTQSIPDFTIAAGNPARPLKTY